MAAGCIDVVSLNIGVVDIEAKVICVAYFGIGYIEFENPETGGDVTEITVHIEVVDGFVLGNRLVVIIGYIRNIPLLVHQVNVVVGIGYHEPFRHFVPTVLH